MIFKFNYQLGYYNKSSFSKVVYQYYIAVLRLKGGGKPLCIAFKYF